MVYVETLWLCQLRLVVHTGTRSVKSLSFGDCSAQRWETDSRLAEQWKKGLSIRK